MKKQLADLKNIQELIRQGAIFFVSHSGGKDSQAMYLLINELVPADQIVVVHANLGDEVEWEGTLEHIENTTNHPVHVVKSSTKTFIEMVERRGMWPSPTTRQCTSDLKTGPIQKFIRNHTKKDGIVVNCTGIRAGESASRKKAIEKKGSFRENKSITAITKNRQGYDWLPLAWFTEEEIFQVIEEAGEKPHWAYGEGMSRLSCCFCIMANKSDLAISAKHNPEKLEVIAEMEKKINHTMFMSKGKPVSITEYIAVKEVA